MKQLSYIYLFLFLALSSSSFAQEKYAIKGKIIDRDTKEPIEMATVIVREQMLWGTSNKDGVFVINNVIPGDIILDISYLGYEKVEYALTLKQHILDLSIAMNPLSLGLNEVVVTAKESDFGTSSTIRQTALEHIQAQSLQDVFQLIPGQTTENPALDSPGQMKIREIAQDDNSALGAALIINGAPVSNNANFQVTSTAKSGTTASTTTVAGKGVDLRDFSTDNIESIEVIRGIPSAEYGDLTSGAMIIKTKAGHTPLEAKVSVNPNTKSYYVGKGFLLKKNWGTLNFNTDYTQSYPENREKMTGYERFNGGVAYSNTFFENTTPLTFNFTSNLFSTLDDEKSDPEIDANEEFRSGKKGVRLGLFGKLALNKAWISNINYNLNYNYTHQEGYEYEYQTISSGTQPLATSYEEGEHEAGYVLGSYYSEMTIDGKPFDFFAQIKANNASKWNKLFNNFLLGAEWRTTGNNGDGKNYDLSKPPVVNSVSTIRPRSFKDIPNLNTFSLFAQDKLIIPVGQTEATLQAGLRFSMLDPLNQLDRVNITSLEPRINSSYQILNRQNNRFFDDLSINIGFGIANKMPTLLHFYPDPAYIDETSLNYYDEDDDTYTESLAVINTKIIEDTSNPDLKAVKNRKLEAGFSFILNEIEGSLTGYYEKQTGGFSFLRQDVFFAHREYEVSGNDRRPYFVENDGVYYYNDADQVVKADYTMDTSFCSYNTPVNNYTLLKKGIEYNFNLGKIKALSTRVIVDGGWLNTRSYNTKDYTSSIVNSYNGETFPYIKLMPAGKTTVRNRLNTNFRTITHIPAVKMVFTLTTQVIWYESFHYEYNDDNGNSRIFVVQKEDDSYSRVETDDVANYTGDNIYKAVAPIAYYDKAGTYHAWDQSQEFTEPYLSMLSLYSDTYFLTEKYAPTVQFNIKVSKEIGKNISFAFNANNFFNIRPLEDLTRSSGYERRNTSLYYGAELKFKL